MRGDAGTSGDAIPSHQIEMMPQTIHYNRHVPAQTAALHELRGVVEREAINAGFAPEAAAQIVLAVDEACTNVIEHSLRDLPANTFRIEIGSRDGRFVVTLTDSGRPFNGKLPEHLDLHALVTSGSSGGLGLHIIARVMDHIAYSSNPLRGNVLRLEKNLP